MRLIAVGLLFSSLLLAQSANRSDNRAEDATTQRLQRSAEVFNEIMATPDKSIPHDLLQRAQCAVIVPSMKKGGFVVGAQYGKGFLMCRQGGSWSAPAAIRVEGGSFGFQIGGSETDVIMLVMNQGGEDKVLSSKFTLGGEGEVAAGPVGRSTTAQTDAKLGAEILSWSRSRGAFAGVALTGATLRQDTDSNEALYGKKLDNREIVKGNVAVPPAAQELISALNRYSSSAKG